MFWTYLPVSSFIFGFVSSFLYFSTARNVLDWTTTTKLLGVGRSRSIALPRVEYPGTYAYSLLSHLISSQFIMCDQLYERIDSCLTWTLRLPTTTRSSADHSQPSSISLLLVATDDDNSCDIHNTKHIATQKQGGTDFDSHWLASTHLLIQ